MIMFQGLGLPSRGGIDPGASSVYTPPGLDSGPQGWGGGRPGRPAAPGNAGWGGGRPGRPQPPIRCPRGYVASKTGQCLPTAPPPGVEGKPAMFQCPGGTYVAAGSACPRGGYINANGMFVPPNAPTANPPIGLPPYGPGGDPVERWRACQATPSAPACIEFMGKIAKERSICANPAAAGHHDCVEFRAFLAAIGEGQAPTPSEAAPAPMPPGMSPGVKKGLIAVGVLGVGLAIAAAVFAPG